MKKSIIRHRCCYISYDSQHQKTTQHTLKINVNRKNISEIR